MTKRQLFRLTVCGVLFGGSTSASALSACDELPSAETLRHVLAQVVNSGDNGGFGLDMWASTVNRDGVVCAVVFSGIDRGDQWPGSRVISAQKATTANAFSLPGLPLSTANLWAPTQPGGSLFGLQFSNPVDTAVAYGDKAGKHGDALADSYGQGENDPMVGSILGGTNVFGGGLALYDETGRLMGAVGVSGDSSCADHNIAWRIRDGLGLDYLPGGVSPDGDDNMIFDTNHAFGHTECGVGDPDAVDNATIVGKCPIGDGATENCLDPGLSSVE